MAGKPLMNGDRELLPDGMERLMPNFSGDLGIELPWDEDPLDENVATRPVVEGAGEVESSVTDVEGEK